MNKSVRTVIKGESAAVYLKAIGNTQHLTRLIVFLVVALASHGLIWPSLASAADILQKKILTPAPVSPSKSPPTAPQAAPKPAPSAVQPKMIRVGQPLVAEGGRVISSGSSKTVSDNTGAGTAQGSGAASGAPVPMKTFTVSDALKATGPR